MAKDVKFNIKLNVDGKDIVVSASTSARKLADNLGLVHDKVTAADRAFIGWTQSVMAIQSVTNSLQQISGVLNTLTEDSRAFGAAMKAANTMAGKDAEGFARLKDQVSGLGESIPMARDELAKGLYQVISNGVPEDNWISYLEASSKAAVGGIANLEEVVKVTSTVIKNYGLEWSAAQDIQDKIQLTAKNGVTSFEQLAAALPSVTGQAAQLGVSFTEMLAVMSTLTGVTGNTSEVATQLASVLTALTKESAKSQKAAGEMGISFNAASVKAAGGLRNYLQELDKTVTAYAQKTGQLKESIYSRLFGRTEALRLVNGLTGEMAQKFEENIAALDSSAGTIDAAFATMSSTGAATTRMLRNQFAAVTDLIAGIVGGIQPYLNFTAQMGMTLLSVTSLTKAIKGLNIVQTTARVFGGWEKAMTSGAAGARALAASLKTLTAASTSAGVAIRGLLVSTGAGVAIAALYTVLEKLNREQSKTAETAGAVRRVQAEAARQYDEQSARVRTLTDLIRNENIATETRKKYIEELKGIIPGYNASLSEEGRLTGENKEAIDRYLSSLEKKIKMQAAEEELTDLYRRQRQELKLLQKEEAAEKEARSRLNTEQTVSSMRSANAGTAGTRALMQGLDVGVQNAQSEYRKAAKAVSETRGRIESLGSAIAAVNKEIAEGSKSLAAETAKAAESVKAAGLPRTGTPQGNPGKGTVGEDKSYLAAQNSLQDYDKAIAYHTKLQQTATQKEYRNLQAVIDALKKRRAEFVGEPAEKPAYSPAPADRLNTLGELTAAIQYYRNTQQEQSAEEMVDTQRTINLLEAKREAMQQLLALPAIEADTEHLQSLEPGKLQMELELIGLDGVRDKLKSLQEMLSTAPEGQRAELEKLIPVWRSYAKNLETAQERNISAREVFGALSSSMSQLGSSVSGGAAEWVNWGANLMNAIAT